MTTSRRWRSTARAVHAVLAVPAGILPLALLLALASVAIDSGLPGAAATAPAEPMAVAAGTFDGRRLLACQRDVARAAGRFGGGRTRVLGRCLAAALRCPGALSGGATAATDACFSRAAMECRAQVAGLSSRQRRLERAAPACTSSVVGVTAERLLDEDGLGFGLLPPFCPRAVVIPDAPGDVALCQRRALTCSADRAVGSAMPRAAELMARLGIVLDDPDRCLLASLCGNGELDGEEECDDGAENSDTAPDACRATCVDPYCGDGVLDSDEDCDDGNVVGGDGCDADCHLESPGGSACGDGILDDGEECDDGPENSDMLADHCRTDCTDPRCGDSIVDPDEGEECEPPATAVCDEDCAEREPGIVVASGAVAASAITGVTSASLDGAARCQRGIVRTGARAFDVHRRLTQRCVLAVARCILAISEDRDPVGNRQEACIEAANRRCTAVIGRRGAIDTRLLDRIVLRCTTGTAAVPLDAETLLDAVSGLGFAEAAEACELTIAGDLMPEAVLACALTRVGCAAESAVARTIPRAYELLGELDLDADEEFPCVTDPLDLG